MEKYESLKQKYPEYISLNQLHRICKISKLSARYLIQNNIIPSIDLGRKTWRYKIALVDTISYLRQRDKVGSMIPIGAATYRSGIKKISNRRSFAEIVTPGQESEVAEYFNFVYADCNDLLTTAQFSEITGLNKNTIWRLAKADHIKSLTSCPKYLIPKQYLLDFVVTQRFLKYQSGSKIFIKTLEDYEVWKAAKS